MRGILTTCVVLATGWCGVQAEETAVAPTSPPPTAAPPAIAASAEQVIQELLQQRQEAPAVDPVRPALTPAPTTGNITDRRVLGVAPDLLQQALGLRREGDFVLSRRGRFVQGESGNPPLFVFAADGARAAEPPLIMAPSQLTEQVEKILQEQGDWSVFTVTGQVLTYRGANYLLPTLIVEDFEQSNLKP